MDLVGHYLQEVAVCDCLFVGTDVYVWRLVEYSCHFFENGLQCSNAIVGLHVIAHCTGKGLAMARHVDFGDNDDSAFGCIILQFLALLLCVVFPFKTCHGCAACELRICLYLKTPCLVFGHVPVESVYLEA